MKSLFLGTAAAILLLCSAADAGQRSWYVGLEGGVEFDGSSANSTDSGWAGLLTVGKGITSNLSLEAELGYRSKSYEGYYWISDYDINQTSLMLNAVYEAPLSKEVSLTIGVGVGGDNVSVGGIYGQGEIEVAAQLKLGVSVAVSEGTDLVANYRYLDTITDSSISDSTLTVGLRFAL